MHIYASNINMSSAIYGMVHTIRTRSADGGATSQDDSEEMAVYIMSIRRRRITRIPFLHNALYITYYALA